MASAAALVVAGAASEWDTAARRAEEALDSGRASAVLEALRKESHARS
jgi:anthranilate phosphoribosyltransferase